MVRLDATYGVARNPIISASSQAGTAVSNPARDGDNASSPFPWLSRNRSLPVLWMVRMLVRLGAFRLFELDDCGVRARIAERLRLPKVRSNDDAGLDDLSRRLGLTLQVMERHSKQFRYGKILENNLALLGRQFALTHTERMVLALAALLRTDEDLYTVSTYAAHHISVAGQIGTILGSSASKMDEALFSNSGLRRAALISVESGHAPWKNLQLRRDELRKLVSTRMTGIEDLFSVFLRVSPNATLSQDDYSHLRPSPDFVVNLIREALDSKRRGVNVLLYGPPGTGKTELARTLANDLQVPLFEVSSIERDGDPLGSRSRLAGAATAQHLLDGRRAILVFDEVDAIFNDGSDFFGKPTTAEMSKAWVNNLLELNQTPAIWIANRIWNMDPAFLRRFDLVIHLESPPSRQRLRLLERECGKFLDARQMQRLARVETMTPAIVTRAASVVRRGEPHAPRAKTLEAVLDATLQGQGLPSLRQSYRGIAPFDYDLSLCNVNIDLDALAQGLARSQAGRICLHGPPGTGKTAFGYWLASALDMPLHLKRISDVQSPFIGEMERKLARVFDQAARDHAVLQIDEVDSFLRDRRGARHAWEVSQVNEFLTQLESFEGIFIASTNLMDGLDQAALRRFDYKIQVGYLRPEQSWQMFHRYVGRWQLPMKDPDGCRRELASMRALTPGDFAVVARRHALCPFEDSDGVMAALQSEIAAKDHPNHRIGFV